MIDTIKIVLVIDRTESNIITSVLIFKKKNAVTLLFKNIFLYNTFCFKYIFDLLAWYEHRLSMTWD